MVKVSITSHMRHGTVSIMEQDRGTGGYGEPWGLGMGYLRRLGSHDSSRQPVARFDARKPEVHMSDKRDDVFPPTQHRDVLSLV